MLVLIDLNNNLADLRWDHDQKGSVLAGQDEAKACFSCCLRGWTAERHQDHVTAERLRGVTPCRASPLLTSLANHHLTSTTTSTTRRSSTEQLPPRQRGRGSDCWADGERWSALRGWGSTVRGRGGKLEWINRGSVLIWGRKVTHFLWGFFLRLHLVGGTLVVMRG